jgi:DNA polymerase III epsilon subunit-like protein
MKILFLDTETNGLPRDWRAPVSKVDNWPRIIQLAWMLTDEFGETIDQQVDLIKPNGWQIPNEPFWINNGFTQETSLAEGIPFSEALKKFMVALNRADVVVAHNMNFDYNVMGAEMIRHEAKADARKEKICTMTVSTDLLKLPGRFEGTFKFPRLEELYQWLFNASFEGAHDALVDVQACRECFFELMDRGHIKIRDVVES